MNQPRSRSTDNRFYGVAEALVTDVNNNGEVKVTFPWFDPNMESEWARVAQFFAGPGHGAFFIPKIGSEVLVAFIHGDMRFPVVIGGLYNGQDLPPGTGTDLDTHVRHYRVETPGGNRVSLFDPESPNAIGAIVIQNANGDSITMATNGTMCIQTSGVLKLDAASIVMNERVLAPNRNPV